MLVASQAELRLAYKGELLVQTFKADLVCFGQIIVELKSVREIAPEHRAQVINYLKASGLKPGLLVNFGSFPKASVTRLVMQDIGTTKIANRTKTGRGRNLS